MLRIFLFAILALIITVYVSVFAKTDPGYVLLSRSEWSIEMSLVMLGLIIVAGLLTLALGFYLLYHVVNLPALMMGWNHRRKLKRSNKNAQSGVIMLAEGKWQDAEKFLGKDLDEEHTPLLNFIAAAKAAQAQGKLSERDKYLGLAFKHYPLAKVAIFITQSELQIQAEQLEDALDTLLHIKQQYPYHPQVLSLLAKIYLLLEKWQQLMDLIPTLRKKKVLPLEDIDQIEIKTISQLFHSCDDLVQIRTIWNDLPRKLKKQSELIYHYTDCLLGFNQQQECSNLLRKHLKSDGNEKLFCLFAQLKENDALEQLRFAEKLLNKYPKNASLLLASAKLCLRNQLWGKARDYISDSIEIEANEEKWFLLGKIYQHHLHDREQAMLSYCQGLELSQAEHHDGFNDNPMLSLQTTQENESTPLTEQTR